MVNSSLFELKYTNKEKEQLRTKEGKQVMLAKKIATRKKRTMQLESEIDEYYHEIRELEGIERKLKQKLQKRCKHKGRTTQDTKYRDFGEDIVRTWCCGS